jgi:hypothetical protein
MYDDYNEIINIHDLRGKFGIDYLKALNLGDRKAVILYTSK